MKIIVQNANMSSRQQKTCQKAACDCDMDCTYKYFIGIQKRKILPLKQNGWKRLD